MAGPAGGTGGTSGTGDAGGDSATISANDFLTLLVTEMQNQDPTADTDPNEYINQLVQVNSLEQLIDINQNLSTALGSSGTDSSGESVSGQAVAQAAGLGTASSTGAPPIVQPAAHQGSALGNIQAAVARASATHPPAAHGAASGNAPGNLSVPADTPAAHRVAHALGSRPHSR
jgi:flagellar basal-body rod modification protein FlgD